jgi:hypothetical protein
MANHEHEPTGFVVKDRRRFDAQGDARNDVDAVRATPSFPSPLEVELGSEPTQTLSQGAALEKNTSGHSTSAQPGDSRPEALDDEEDGSGLDFSSFIISLATQASIQLGLMPPPPGMEAPIDHEAAKQTIDIIGLIQRKTRGNLGQQEKALLTNILHELRIGFVQVTKVKK